jgi:alpha-ketoglutarate-dependent taurine dioxygenase
MTINIDEIYKLSYLARSFEPNQYNPPAINTKKYTIELNAKIDLKLTNEIIIDKFNEYKFVIIKENSLTKTSTILEDLVSIFGEMIEQTPVKGSTIYSIESSRTNSTSTKNNNYQPPHSDGNFKPNPPKIIALQCLKNSELGGYTKLVYAKNIYNSVKQINPRLIDSLFDNEAITFYRKDRNSKELRIVEYKKAIFYNLENERIGISFNPMMSKIESTPKIEQLYKLISHFVSKPKNQLTFQLKTGETLIADNYSLLHARTAFPEDGGRLLRRAWYDGCNTKLKLGFTP